MTTIGLPDSYYAETPPVPAGRAAAVDHLLKPGPVYQVGSMWLITSYEASDSPRSTPPSCSPRPGLSMASPMPSR